MGAMHWYDYLLLVISLKLTVYQVHTELRKTDKK